MSVMDPQSVAFTPRDIWSEMFRVQQAQAEHAERLMRLERRQDEDARVKSVWGSSSPFPGVLSGTPQQVALHHPPADSFANFDDHSSNLLSSLHLDADDEPRRIGATSRANSVRFDESANQGHWAHASRSSIDLIPRTGSGMGGHPMTERSYSHKSDGRQSSAGVSVHSATSGRANSLGLETSYGINPTSASPLEPPGLAPGLFILGSVPSIIRCWLNTNFKHDSLLYAAVCTGSYTSFLDLHMIRRLGFEDQIFQDDEGIRRIKLCVYLPEAIPHPASSRSNSPAPQLPSLTVEFTVVERCGYQDDSKAIQIFLGSDMLRAHNADILFSSNKLTLFDDDRSKLSIPLVRPEDERTFKNLFVSSGSPDQPAQKNETSEGAPSASSAAPSAEESSISATRAQSNAVSRLDSEQSPQVVPSDEGSGSTSSDRMNLEQRPVLGLLNTQAGGGDAQDASAAIGSAPRSRESPAIWSNWRREAEKPVSTDWANATKGGSQSSYQRREQGIKVLKPLKPGLRTLSSTALPTPPSAPTPTGQSRYFDDGRRRTSTPLSDSAPQLKRAVSGESKTSTTSKENQPLVSKTRSANPVGGASAFAWLNSTGQSK